MTASKNLVFFGNERLSTGFSPDGSPTLQLLINAGYTVSAVVANHEAGTSRNARKLEIEEVAKKHNIPVLLPAKPADIKEELAAFNASVGVLVAYGRIIPQSIIDIFPKGILNIHPSLLPHYRGSTPIEQAILDGATETGVSIMQLVKKMDAGPIYAQTAISLNEGETKQALTSRLLHLGGKLLLDTLPEVLTGTATPRPQEEEFATFTSLIKKTDSTLDPTKPALQLEREVRAFAGWPKSKTTIFGHLVTILQSRVVEPEQGGALILPCKDSFLEIEMLVAPSGRTISGADFIRGYKKSS